MPTNLPPGVTGTDVDRQWLTELPQTDDCPVDEWECEADGCTNPLGWLFWETDDAAGLSWRTTFVLPDDRMICEDCGAAINEREDRYNDEACAGPTEHKEDK